MNWWIPIGIVAVVLLCYIANRRGWINLSRTNRKSVGGGMLGVVDEVFAPTRHEAAVELERQTVLPAPAPTPGDGHKGVYDGRISIDLPGEDKPTTGDESATTDRG